MPFKCKVRRYNKVVVLIIDCARFDFAAPSYDPTSDAVVKKAPLRAISDLLGGAVQVNPVDPVLESARFQPCT